MIQYQKHVENTGTDAEHVLAGIDAVPVSMRKYTWYLEQTLIPLALIDPNIPDIEREKIGKRLLSVHVPEVLEPSYDLVLLDVLDFHQEKPLSLSDLIGPNSWYIFHLLKISSSQNKPWLSCPASVWPFVDQYKLLSDFVRKLAVVNDAS